MGGGSLAAILDIWGARGLSAYDESMDGISYIRSHRWIIGPAGSWSSQQIFVAPSGIW